MTRVISRAFFNRPTLLVARELLGCFLCRKIGKQVIRLMITEVEAYDGPKDKASHANCGQTARNAPMFGEAGKWYVYFTYGMHWMLNIVTSPVGYPAAILIRGGVLSCGGLTSAKGEIRGPARLTKALKIDYKLNNKRATRRNGLWIEQGDFYTNKKIQRTARIGVPYAHEWAKRPYRFLLKSANQVNVEYS